MRLPFACSCQAFDCGVIFCVCSLRVSEDFCMLLLLFLRKAAKREPNGAKREPKWGQTGQKVAKTSPRELLRTRLVSEVEFGSSIVIFRASFWRHLGGFGCHLGPSRAPKGVPKSHFWRQVRQKIEKGDTKKRCRKLHAFLQTTMPKGCQKRP